MKEIVIIVLLYILIILCAVALGSLIFWGLGNLFVFVFKFDYEWTILHGFFMELLFILIRSTLTNTK